MLLYLRNRISNPYEPVTTHAWEIDDTRVQEAFVRGAGALVSAVGSIPALGTYGLAFQLAGTSRCFTTFYFLGFSCVAIFFIAVNICSDVVEGGLIQAGASLVSILNTNDRLARSHTIGTRIELLLVVSC